MDNLLVSIVFVENQNRCSCCSLRDNLSHANEKLCNKNVNYIIQIKSMKQKWKRSNPITFDMSQTLSQINNKMSNEIIKTIDEFIRFIGKLSFIDIFNLLKCSLSVHYPRCLISEQYSDQIRSTNYLNCASCSSIDLRTIKQRLLYSCSLRKYRQCRSIFIQYRIHVKGEENEQ